jgi:putative transcriptional regulator
MRYTDENTDAAILAELGERLTHSRLARNFKQDDLARMAGVSKRTIERLEKGESVQLTNLIRALRALEMVQNLERLVPESTPSPLRQLKLRGKQRHRASSPRAAAGPPGHWTWGDDT